MCHYRMMNHWMAGAGYAYYPEVFYRYDEAHIAKAVDAMRKTLGASINLYCATHRDDERKRDINTTESE